MARILALTSGVAALAQQGPQWPQAGHDAQHTGRSPFVGTGTGTTQKWTYRTGDAVQSSPAIGADGTVFLGSNDNNVYALDGNTGALKWSYATQGPVVFSPAIGSDGTVYVGT